MFPLTVLHTAIITKPENKKVTHYETFTKSDEEHSFGSIQNDQLRCIKAQHFYTFAYLV